MRHTLTSRDNHMVPFYRRSLLYSILRSDPDGYIRMMKRRGIEIFVSSAFPAPLDRNDRSGTSSKTSRLRKPERTRDRRFRYGRSPIDHASPDVLRRIFLPHFCSADRSKSLLEEEFSFLNCGCYCTSTLS